MFRAWDDAVRVLTGRPTGSKVTGEVFDVQESDEHSIQNVYRSNRSYGRPSFSSIVRDADRKQSRRSKRPLQ